MEVRPLTRRTTDGNVLTRSAEVEAQITQVLRLEPLELQRRLGVADREDSAYLKEETVVYLIRETHRQGNATLCGKGAEPLLRQCVPQAEKYLRALGEQQFEKAFADLTDQVFELILDLESDKGDFLQVRFGLKLKQLAIDVFRRHKDQINEESAKLTPWSSIAGHDDQRDEDESRRVQLPPEMRFPDSSTDRKLLAQEALRLIPEPQRTAFILFHYDGWPIESKDAHCPTISRQFGRTPRTIHNWLRMADEILERWRAEHL
jgi:hypothetical protein